MSVVLFCRGSGDGLNPLSIGGLRMPALGSRACALVSCVNSAEKTILSAVEKAQDILAHYVQPGTRDWGDTINRLMDVLDDSRLLEAVEQVKK